MMDGVERAAEWFAIVTCVIIGLSHVLQRRTWAEAYASLYSLGKPGALINGGLHLFPGAAFVAAHPVWMGPATALTVFGWLLVVKGAICLLWPEIALRSMARAGAGDGHQFAIAGFLLMAFAAVLAYAL